MVGRNLQRHEQRSDQSTQPIFTSIAKHHTGNGRRNISQSNELPDMSGRNDDKEIGRERPDDSPQTRHPHLEVKGTKQDIEAQEHHKHIPYISRQIQMIQILYPLEQVRRVVTRCHLVSRHPTKNRIGPTGTLTGTFQVFLSLLAGTDTCHRVMLRKNASFGHRRTEVSK